MHRNVHTADLKWKGKLSHVRVLFLKEVVFTLTIIPKQGQNKGDENAYRV